MDNSKKIDASIDPIWNLEIEKTDYTTGGGPYTWKKICLLIAMVAAFCGILLSVLRLVLEKPTKICSEPILLAFHGEQTTRTRHILLARAATNGPRQALVLGRPRENIRAIERKLSEQGIVGLTLVRPLDINSMLCALAKSHRRFIQAWIVFKCLSNLKIRIVAGIIYRVLQGDAHQIWWRKHGLRHQIVIYGHTGIADTSLLELEQQRSGVRTVHWFHGLSLGPIFNGISDFALVKCASDARWHEHLGGYGRVILLQAQRPRFRIGQSGWCLFSNLIHPMNECYNREGPIPELRLLEMVHEAKKRVGNSHSNLTWKPHPVFDGEPREIQRTILSALKGWQFNRWPDDMSLELAAKSQIIISTPSSVAIDLLHLGVLPIIVSEVELDPKSAMAQFPLIARSISDLCDAVEQLDDPCRAEHLFECAWDSIGPSKILEIREMSVMLGNH